MDLDRAVGLSPPQISRHTAQSRLGADPSTMRTTSDMMRFNSKSFGV
jgi:hypothetical protein